MVRELTYDLNIIYKYRFIFNHRDLQRKTNNYNYKYITRLY